MTAEETVELGVFACLAVGAILLFTSGVVIIGSGFEYIAEQYGQFGAALVAFGVGVFLVSSSLAVGIWRDYL